MPKLVDIKRLREQKKTHGMQTRKQTTWYLMPDAPSRKKKRNSSPIRVPCPLLPGVPVTPPPKKVPVRKKKKLPALNPAPAPTCEQRHKRQASSGPSRCINVEVPDDSGQIHYVEDLDPNAQIVAVIELQNPAPNCEQMQVANGPSRCINVEVPDELGQIHYVEDLDPNDQIVAVIELQNPAPTCEQMQTASVPSSCINIELPDDSGQIHYAEDLDPNAQIVETEIELIGFTTPTSSIDPLRVEHSTPSLQFRDNTNDDDNDDGTPNDVDPGSDIDDVNLSQADDVVVAESMGPCSMPDTEDLPPNLAHALTEMDNRDDSALREAASDPNMLHFDWTNDPDKFAGKQEKFTGEAGPTFSVDGLSHLDVFQRFWDTEIIGVIVRESNRYGRRLYENANNVWSDINANDIWVFFAVLMLQSILILPVEREYWYPCMPLLKIGDFYKIMSYKKFSRIKKCLHFVDNNMLKTENGENRKLQKIWPIIAHLNNKFSSLYLPEQYIAIDESLLLWKGRLSFVQHIATKSARVGIKSYELCESRTGYLWRMLIYTGRVDKSHPNNDVANQDEPDVTPTSKIVYNLIRPLLNKGYTLIMDNFYNSPLLSRSLKSKKTDTMGTLRLNRQFVPDELRNITKSNTRTGEVIFSQTEDITITVWHDSKIVAMISTYHKAVVGGKEKHGTYKYKPQVVLDYNMTMGGVDKKDQMLQAFPIERMRNLIWYKKVFRRLLNCSIYNAFVIFNHKKNGNQRQFRVALAKEILEKMGRLPDPRGEITRTNHFPAKGESKRSRCKLCTSKGFKTRTVYKCDTCNVSLCVIGCFREYHLTGSEV